VVLSLAYPNLPSLEILTDYRPKIPLRVFTADGYLLGEFGEERRAVVSIEDVPVVLKQAILAAEDERFYQHGGVDTLGVLRALHANLLSGGKRQGASTITQQVAKNFFLSSEKTYTRKLYEALLSFKIENNLSKDQIFELYINQIFLGQRAYGFRCRCAHLFRQTAGRTDARRSGNACRTAESALRLQPGGQSEARPHPAGVCPAPNERTRLHQRCAARDGPGAGAGDPARRNETPIHAEFVTEMARQIAAERFPDDVYTRGLRVYTTIRQGGSGSGLHQPARGVLDYDRRHGYRGAEAYVDLAGNQVRTGRSARRIAAGFPGAEDLQPAIVLQAETKKIRALPARWRRRSPSAATV
jgi:penicillin-binding protein 1A